MSLDNSRKTFTVWVGGSEVTDHYVTEEKAVEIAWEWRDKGYTDVVVEYIKSADHKKDLK